MVVTPSRRSEAFAGPAHVLGLPVHAEKLPVLGADVAELGGEQYFIALPRDGSPDQSFILERPVHVRRIEKGRAELERPADGGDRFGFVPSGVELAHAHAAEADRG